MNSFVLVCAYRDNEINDTHPFKILVDDIPTKNKNLLHIKLNELDSESVMNMIVDACHCAPQKAKPFADLITKKTNGNPFFVQQFMRQVVQDKLVAFDYKTQTWNWSLERLDKVQCADNIVEFIIEKVKRMPPFVQKIMQHASCLANTFEISVLNGVATSQMQSDNSADYVDECSAEQVEQALHQGIQAGFIYQNRVLDRNADSHTKIQYKFIHDRVQEAFYEMMEANDRTRYHIAAAGYFLPANVEISQNTQDTLFTVAHHYNVALPFFQTQLHSGKADDVQIRHIVRVYYEAAKKAKESTAVEAACQFLSNAIKLLPDELLPFPESVNLPTGNEIQEIKKNAEADASYVFHFDLLALQAECEASCGNMAAATKVIEYLLERGRSVRDKVRAISLKCLMLEMVGDYSAHLMTSLTAVELLNMPLKLKDNPLDELVVTITKLMASEKDTSVFIQRQCDEMDSLRIEIMSNLLASAYIVAGEIGMNLYYGCCAYGTILSLENGMTAHSASLMACYAALLTELRIPHAVDYAQLSMACLRKYPHPVVAPRNNHYVSCFTLWQGKPMKDVREVYEEGFRGLIAVGDTYALYSAITMIPCRFAAPVPDEEAYFKYMVSNLRSMKPLSQIYVDCIEAVGHCFSTLRNGTLIKKRSHIRGRSTGLLPTIDENSTGSDGVTPGYSSPESSPPPSPSSDRDKLVWGGFEDGFDEVKFANANDDNNGSFFSSFMLLGRMKTCILLSDYERARELDKKIRPESVVNLLSQFDWETTHALLLADSLLPPLPGEAPSENFTKGLEEIKELIRDWKFFEKSPCLDAAFLLVDAEVARLEGDTEEARRKFDESIECAKRREIGFMSGLTNERAMKFCLDRNDIDGATQYLLQAKAAYITYGANTKVQLLESNYADLLKTVHADTPVLGSLSANLLLNPNNNANNTTTTTTTTVDFISVMKACQAISSEMNIDKLLCSMIKITQQNTGAQKAVFIAPDDNGKLFIKAYGDGNSNIGTTHTDLYHASASPSSSTASLVGPDANAMTVPVSVIQYVRSTKQIVILEDATSAGNFLYDTYIQTNRIKSILCLPIVFQNAVVGILYFENNLLPGAFNQDRVQTVQLLSGQLAISYINAILFKNLQTANQQLEQKNKALVEFDQMKDQFLANTSHELRTPLNGIIGLAEYLLESEVSKPTAESLSMIVSSGRRLANLVNDILDISALKAGTFTVCPKPTDLGAVAKMVIDLSYHLLGSKDVTLTNAVGDLPTMNVDEARMQQVLQNIIGNAIKFTRKGFVKVTSQETRDWISISVEDSGCGIAPEDLNMIFEEFKQIDGGSSREAGGTGLGLSIAKKMVEMHGGNISVVSVVGKGSTFTINLPTSRIVNEPHQIIKPATTKKHNTPSGNPKTITILSVDDEPVNQVIMAKFLGANFNVIQANNGQEALDLIMKSNSPPDFVLLDVMMPQMSGLEVCEKIREKFPMCDLPVIMVSAKGKPENITEGLSKGANDYITKPFNKNELLARIRLQISICLSCKALCEKTHNHAPNNQANMLEMLVCEGCRQAPTYPGQKSLIIGRRSSKEGLAQSILEEQVNIAELMNNLPMLVTLYTPDGVAMMRNTHAAHHFKFVPNSPIIKNNTFIFQLQDRMLANTILTQVLAGQTVHHVYETTLDGNHVTVALCCKLITIVDGGWDPSVSNVPASAPAQKRTGYIFVGEQIVSKNISHRFLSSTNSTSTASPTLSLSTSPAELSPIPHTHPHTHTHTHPHTLSNPTSPTHNHTSPNPQSQSQIITPPPNNNTHTPTQNLSRSLPTTHVLTNGPTTTQPTQQQQQQQQQPTTTTLISVGTQTPTVPTSTPTPTAPTPTTFVPQQQQQQPFMNGTRRGSAYPTTTSTYFPPRLSEGSVFLQVDYTQLNPLQMASLGKWVQQLTTELNLAKFAQQHTVLTVYYRKPTTQQQPQPQQQFFHVARLPAPSVDLLRNEVSSRLKLDSNQVLLIRDGNLIVEDDQDIIPGLHVDVYVQ